MSRVGKNPVVIPAGVTIELNGQHLKAKGKRGELELTVHDDVSVVKEAEGLVFKPRTDSRRARMQWGTARNLASNVVRGVSDGFTINLEINGVGYRASADAKMLKMQLGFSHDVEIPIPAGIQIKAVKPTEIEISGSDRQRVGQVAAEIRSLRPPEPYKGKGIKYSTETIRRKEGKKK
jgi:large subunit ribosomal protein L6